MRSFVVALGLTLGAIVVSAQGWPPRNGASLPANCVTGEGYFVTSTAAMRYYACTATDTWTLVDGTAAAGGLDAGLIVLSLTSCPAGYAEETTLNGKFVLGTLDANADVTTTGGADTITSILNHTHPVTDPGHTHNQGIRNSGTAGTAGVQGASTANNATITNGVPSATTGITTANPAGGVASIDNRPAFVRVIFCRKT